MNKKLVVTSSPFIRDYKTSVSSLMRDVCIALIPTIIASIIFFGLRALIIYAIAIFSALVSEYIFEKITKKKTTLNDYSALVTGLLVACNMPSSAPFWLPAFGSIIAIILVKQLYGGIGQNFMNPALIARTILFISWTSLMSARIAPEAFNFMLGITSRVDTLTYATPLGINPPKYSFLDLFIGNIPGMIGETSKIALLIGGLYLIYRKVIDWRIPLSIIASLFILFFIKDMLSSEKDIYNILKNCLYQILSGGLFIGAFFMATDYVTCPIHKLGRVIMGILCALIIFVIRAYGSYPEGTSFAILFMNILTPTIDKFTRPKTFGEGRL